MSRKSLKILLILVTIFSLISTFSLATDTSAVQVTSTDTSVTSENPEATTTDGTTTDDTATEENTENPTTETGAADVNNDLYLSDNEVTISDTVNGNVFVLANTLTVNGQIGGDLFAIAKTVNIDGAQIYGNVFVLADTLTLNGMIYDLYASCNTLNVSYDGVAYRDLKVTCNNATLNGVVGKNLNIKAGSSLTFESECVIYGDLNYSAPNELEIAEGIVSGSVNYEKATSNNTSVWDYVSPLALLSTLIYTLIIWLLMSKVAPKFYGKVTSMTPKKMGISILIGLLALILTPIVSLILLITVIGVPVAFALMVVYGLIIAISSAMTTIALAAKLSDKVKALAKLNNILSVIIVAVVLWLLSLIPFVGGFISFLVVICGFGMFLMSIFNKKEKVVEAEVGE